MLNGELPIGIPYWCDSTRTGTDPANEVQAHDTGQSIGLNTMINATDGEEVAAPKLA